MFTVLLPPASVTARLAPSKEIPVFNSLVGSASASSIRLARSANLAPPASVTLNTVPLNDTAVFNSLVGSASASLIDCHVAFPNESDVSTAPRNGEPPLILI